LEYAGHLNEPDAGTFTVDTTETTPVSQAWDYVTININGLARKVPVHQ
jgi:hypothetical protein